MGKYENDYEASRRQNHTRTLLTGTLVYHLDNTALYEIAVMYYDKYGHVVQTRSTNHLGGYDMIYNEVDFLGKPLKTYKTHTIHGPINQTTELYTYKYDKAQRLQTTKHTLNSGAEVTLSDNTYDDLGRLQTKKVGNSIETTTYSYNIRNWVTGINGIYFIENLNYNTDPANISNFAACYNGNIAAMQWSIPSENLGYNRTYAFSYDALNRLTGSNYCNGNYDEAMMYNKMGNITEMFRKDDYGDNDDIGIYYIGNQLSSISDANYHPQRTYEYGSEGFIGRGNNLATQYKYDLNGNMTYDANSGISTIQYNSLNLPEVIQFTEGHQNYYTYDAAGQKLDVTNYNCIIR